jgi:hypothetical protein
LHAAALRPDGCPQRFVERFFPYVSLGAVLRLQGDYVGAAEAFATSIRIGQRRAEPPSPDTLDRIAALWTTLGHHERAARMAGAAERAREQLGAGPFFATGTTITGLVWHWHPDTPLPERIEPAWSEGREMTCEEAAEYALDELSGA